MPDDVKPASPFALPLEFCEWNEGMVFYRCYGLIDANDRPSKINIGDDNMAQDDGRDTAKEKALHVVHCINEYPKLVARLELADRMFALFEEYHGTGRHEAYGDMVGVYRTYRAGKEPTDE